MINLITGGAGFIGSNLIEKLLSNGEKIICIDNFISSNKINTRKWGGNPNFNLILHDIVEPINNIKANKIWHLACPASPEKYIKDPIKTLEINFLGTLNVLKLAKTNNAKLLLASTSEIYGDPEIHPQNESYKGSVNTLGQRSCYVEGKRIAETLCHNYAKRYCLDIKIARIFNSYGPNMLPNDGRVISNFICSALREKKIFINGNGQQTRSFCFIDDLIDGLIKLMNSNYLYPINIGNPNEEYSICSLANLIIKKLDPNIQIIFGKEIEDDPKKRKPDIFLANSILNWDPKINLDSGLNKTIAYFKKII